MARGVAAYTQGRWPEALEQNDRSTAVYRDRCTGVEISLDLSAYYALRALGWLGDFAELRSRRKALLKDAEERQDLFSMTNYRTEVMSLDLLADDDPAGAAGEIEDAMKHWSHRSFHAQHLFALVGGVRIELYRGRGAAARALIDAARRDYEASQLHRSCIGRINMYNILACSALAARPAGSGNLDREATAAAAGLDRERIPYASALAQMGARAGGLAARRPCAPIRVYRDAAEAYRSLSMLLHEAATLARLGELLGGDEGHGLEGRSTDWMESQRIRNPAAMVRMILP